MKRHAAGKARTVAKGHKHAKPAHAHHKAATGHAHKHHKAAKHHKVAHKHKGQVHRGLAIGDAVACCAAEALAASLRLSGVPVSDADVLDLYWRTADDPDAGAPILAALEAASEFGIGGIRPASFGLVNERGQSLEGPASLCHVHPPRQRGVIDDAVAGAVRLGHGTETLMPSGLILGLDLPGGPHTVTADVSGDVWSWGELYSLDELEAGPIEEAWEVTWL